MSEANDTDPNDAAPASVPAGATPRRRHRAAWWLGGGLGAVVLLVALGIAVIVWAVRSASGTAWLLTLAPQVSVVAPKGALLGDFAADRLDVAIPDSGVLRLDAVRWQGSQAGLGDRGRWLRLTIASLHADRVTWLPTREPVAPNAAPARPPETLRLPIELQVAAASVGELRIGSADATPVRDLRARVHLGADGGALHRLDDAAAAIERARARGTLTIGADAPFAVSADITAQSQDVEPAFDVRLAATGPLDAMSTTATARVAASATRPAQSLDARAVVKPFAPWPLGELNASFAALDLSAFAAAAPATSLTGKATVAMSGLDVPAVLSLEVDNARAGRISEGLLPVQRAVAELRARPDRPGVLEVQALSAELGSAARPGGRLTGSGRYGGDGWQIDATLDRVRPLSLDARAPETTLAGTLALVGTGFASAATAAIDITAQLTGQLADPRLPRAAPRDARLRLAARATSNEVDVKSAEARLGDAAATLVGKLARSNAQAPWRATGRLQLARFDPAPWWPGGADLFARGANQLDGQAEVDLVLPAGPTPESIYALLAALRGKATLSIGDSLVAGMPLVGEGSYANSDGQALSTLELVAAGNRVKAEGRIAAAGAGGDEWRVAIDAPRLEGLAPLLAPPAVPAVPAAPAAPAAPASRAASAAAVARAAAPRLAGTLTATGRVSGRWPDLTSEGELQAATVRYDALTVRRATGRWRAGSADNAALDGTLVLDGIDFGGRAIAQAEARVTGTAAAHRAELRVDSAALPPAWVDALSSRVSVTPAAVPATAANAAATASATAAPTTAAPTTAPATATATTTADAATATTARSRLAFLAEGGLVSANGERAAGWRGTLRELTAQSTSTPVRSWLRVRDVRGGVLWGGGPLRADLEPGSAEALGGSLRWSRVAWQSGEGTAAGRLDVQATVDAFPVAPALQALQADFGWGGDLLVGARIDVRSTPQTKVDVVVERLRGDLTVSDELGTLPLGVTALRTAVVAEQGLWRFTAALAGSAVGVASADITARTAPSATWPAAETAIQGTVAARVEDLGTLGAWVPAGWRLAGELRADATVGGRFGAPQYTGRVEGRNLGVRNFVEGVNVSDGVIAIALAGNTARVETFTAKGGAGTVRLDGQMAVDEAPTARLRVVAERFEVLGRVDRRIVVSGTAALRLDARSLGLDGEFKVDEGLVDFTRSDAPALGSDVEVVRRPVVAAPKAPGATSYVPGTAAAPVSAGTSAAPTPPLVPTPARTIAIDLRVGMGEDLRVRGRGLDAGLRGELRITSPGNRIAVNGTLQTRRGTYQAYGQKLGIDRGVLTFTGPVENPRLDIEATRPDIDVRAGVIVTGTALYPRIRLFSEPDMSDLDKLSWLVLGRASETTGGADTALLQQAALALLSGEGPGVTDRLIKSVGLDAVSVRQQQTGAVKDTIVSLGKQISKRWYVGYERGLNSTVATWQLIYRLARRVTIKAEAGSDNAIDVNWTLRWK